MTTMPLLSTGLTVLFAILVIVRGDYELQVMFYRFDNPNQRCEECHLSNGSTITAGCCDNLMTGDQCDSKQCDMYFTFCHRLLNTSNSSRECPDMVIDRKNNSAHNTDGVSFRSVVFGLPNPHTFSGHQWEGTQFYLEFKDRDFVHLDDGPDDLIDTLAVDVNIPVGASISQRTYVGRFNNAQVELSFKVVCAENYYGPDCTRFCNDSICPCDPGYTGEFCETINDCEGVNCSGQGTCVDEIESFSCQCDPGYTGDLCEIDIDYCAGVNCSGNGRCEEIVDSFVCLCNSSFTGVLCETNTSECDGVNCGTNGQCVEVMDSYTCVCHAGYTGELCDQLINTCTGVNCSRHGVCVNGTDNYSCVCDHGYTGVNCEREIFDNCVGVTCNNNGQCEDRTESYICLCNAGFTGELCETNIDKCTGIDCGQGRCMNRVNSYYCECDSGHTGTHCETKIDPCAGIDCGKNKECKITDDSYTCVCITGYTGETCEAKPKTNGGSLGVIIGGAVGGAIVILILLILVILIIVMCCLRRSIKRMHYNVEDVLKSQSITPGDNPIYAGDTDDQKVPVQEMELKNPIYDDAHLATTTFAPTEERKFDNPIYETSLPQEKQLNNENGSARPTIANETETLSNGTAVTMSHDQVNPILSTEDRNELVGNTNPLFTHSHDDIETSSDLSGEASKQEASCSSLVKSSIYDDDFMKPDSKPIEEHNNTGNELTTFSENKHQSSGAKLSYRRQDYEDVA